MVDFNCFQMMMVTRNAELEMEQSGGSGGGGEYGGEDEDDEETQLRRAIELSMAEAGGGGEPADAGDGAAGGRGRGGRGNRGRGRGGALDQYACCTSVCLPTLLTSLCACAQVERVGLAVGVVRLEVVAAMTLTAMTTTTSSAVHWLCRTK